MDWSSILKLASTASIDILCVVLSGGLLFWMFYSYIPAMQREFHESLKEAHDTNEKQAADFQTSLKEQRVEFLAALATERAAYGNALNVAIASNAAIEKAVNKLSDVVTQFLYATTIRTGK